MPIQDACFVSIICTPAACRQKIGSLIPDVLSTQVPDIMALRNMENLSVSEGVAGVVKYGVKGLLGLAYKV